MRDGMAWHTLAVPAARGLIACPIRHGMQGVLAQSSVPMHWGGRLCAPVRGGTAPPGMLLLYITPPALSGMLGTCLWRSDFEVFEDYPDAAGLGM